MATSEQLLAVYQDQIVPRSFNGGFVALSYVVSLIGAASTLELINRRTSRNGLFNHLILLSAAVTMGGIAIWCMHFIGNRAIDLANGETELQIVYSSGFTALSFFIPILVLLTAFLAVGTNNRVSWWRIIVGGSLAGSAICGMHYLGNASIDNYTCVYTAINVVGAALIAVAASIVALALFFVFRASWTNSWWKRGMSAIVMAGAVSGMHWCASIGTQYRLVRLNDGTNQLSRNTTVVVVICLSVAAALIIAGTVVYTTHVMRGYAEKAQQVVLAAAVFDRTGRILVNPDGLLPSEKITDSYLEKTPSDTFNIAHPLFHWMFQASRNWSSLRGVTHNMSKHLALLPRNGRDSKVRLIDENGQLIENYDIIFRELFCLAAVSLAEKTKGHIEDVGILWDDILPTGACVQRRRKQSVTDEMNESDGHALTPIPSGDMGVMTEKGEGWKARQQEYGRGALMFLVRRLDNTHDMDRLQARGFRFAEVNQVAGIIGSSMQIKTRNLSSKLMNMATYAEENTMMEPGVHVGFFGLRARVGSYGFDVLVRKGARNLLPTMQMPLDHLESWQMDFIRRLDRMSVAALCQELDTMKRLSPREMVFASQVFDTIEALRAWVDDPIFDEATLTARVVQVPCRQRPSVSSATTCSLITLKIVIPIHVNVNSPKCEFVPLTFFKTHQLVYKDSPHHAAFSRTVHRDIAPIINSLPANAMGSAEQKGRTSSWQHGLRRLSHPWTGTYPVDADGNPIPTELGHKSGSGSNHSSSTLKLWNGPSHERSSLGGTSDKSLVHRPDVQVPTSLGGIMISQEIKVDVREAGDLGDGGRRYSVRYLAPSGPIGGSEGVDRFTMVNPGHKKTNTLASDIELTALAETRGAMHSGAALGSAVVESVRADEVTTFADELFSICVDDR